MVDLATATAEEVHEYWRGMEAARHGAPAHTQPGETGDFWLAGWRSISSSTSSTGEADASH